MACCTICNSLFKVNGPPLKPCRKNISISKKMVQLYVVVALTEKKLEGDREKDETGNCETSNTGKRPRPCSDDEEDVQEEDGEDNNNNIKTSNTSRLLTPGARNVSTIGRILELKSIIIFF